MSKEKDMLRERMLMSLVKSGKISHDKAEEMLDALESGVKGANQIVNAMVLVCCAAHKRLNDHDWIKDKILKESKPWVAINFMRALKEEGYDPDDFYKELAFKIRDQTEELIDEA